MICVILQQGSLSVTDPYYISCGGGGIGISRGQRLSEIPIPMPPNGVSCIYPTIFCIINQDKTELTVICACILMPMHGTCFYCCRFELTYISRFRWRIWTRPIREQLGVMWPATLGILGRVWAASESSTRVNIATIFNTLISPSQRPHHGIRDGKMSDKCCFLVRQNTLSLATINHYLLTMMQQCCPIPNY